MNRYQRKFREELSDDQKADNIGRVVDGLEKKKDDSDASEAQKKGAEKAISKLKKAKDELEEASTFDYELTISDEMDRAMQHLVKLRKIPERAEPREDGSTYSLPEEGQEFSGIKVKEVVITTPYQNTIVLGLSELIVKEYRGGIVWDIMALKGIADIRLSDFTFGYCKAAGRTITFRTKDKILYEITLG